MEGLVTVGQESFTAKYKRGFKWVGVNNSDEEKGRFFEEINTQLLAEYLNDPEEKDQLFNLMIENPTYKYSLAPNYVKGSAILRQIYAKLGIRLEEVEELHFNAKAEKLLKKIDERIEKLGIKLEKSPSEILLNLKPANPQTEEGLEPLKELASKI